MDKRPGKVIFVVLYFLPSASSGHFWNQLGFQCKDKTRHWTCVPFVFDRTEPAAYITMQRPWRQQAARYWPHRPISLCSSFAEKPSMTAAPPTPHHQHHPSSGGFHQHLSTSPCWTWHVGKATLFQLKIVLFSAVAHDLKKTMKSPCRKKESSSKINAAVFLIKYNR